MLNQFGAPTAVAIMRADPVHEELRGKVWFIPSGNGTMVIADISGLPESATGFFGFHIHEGGNCEGEGFQNTGGHYDPAKLPHPSHAGDLPSLLSCQGSAYLAVLTDRFQVRDVIGRTVVIHSDPDDFGSQPSGNAGAKIACGVIRGATD